MDNGKGGGWKKEGRKGSMLYEDDIAIVKDDCYRYIEIKLKTKCVWGDEGPKLKGNAQGSRR